MSSIEKQNVENYLFKLVTISWVITLWPIIGAFYMEVIYWYFKEPTKFKKNKYGFINPESFLGHWENSVCGFGKSTGAILSILLLGLSSFLTVRYIQIKKSDTIPPNLKSEMKIVFYSLLSISAVYFVLQLRLNSTLKESVKSGNLYGPALFEYFIPYYFLIIIFLTYTFYIFNGKKMSRQNEIILYVAPVVILFFVYSIPIFGFERYIKMKKEQVMNVLPPDSINPKVKYML
jgi:hypothetical protein